MRLKHLNFSRKRSPSSLSLQRKRRSRQQFDSDNLYPVISMHQADSGDFVGAFSTAEHIVAVESKDAAIQWIAADAAKLGKIEIVRQAMDGLQDAHRQPELNVLMAGALARAGQPKEALDLAKKHLDLTHQALALIYVAQSYLDSGDRMKGLELLGAAQLATKSATLTIGAEHLERSAGPSSALAIEPVQLNRSRRFRISASRGASGRTSHPSR